MATLGQIAQRAIQRKEKRAKELKLPLQIWEIYNGYVKRFPGWQNSSPNMIPANLRETLICQKNLVSFMASEKRLAFYFEESQYFYGYATEEVESEDFGKAYREGHAGVSRKIELLVDQYPVFGLESLKEAKDPTDKLHLTRFIEGDWCADIPRLLAELNAHQSQQFHLDWQGREEAEIEARLAKFGLTIKSATEMYEDRKLQSVTK